MVANPAGIVSPRTSFKSSSALRNCISLPIGVASLQELCPLRQQSSPLRTCGAITEFDAQSYYELAVAGPALPLARALRRESPPLDSVKCGCGALCLFASYALHSVSGDKHPLNRSEGTPHLTLTSHAGYHVRTPLSLEATNPPTGD